MGGGFAAPVADQHARVAERGGQAGGGGMSLVVPDVADGGRIKAGQRLRQELRGQFGVGDPQVVPGVVKAERVGRRHCAGS